MELISVKDVLFNEKLAYPTLNVLQARNPDLYSVLLVQPEAEIKVTTTSITNYHTEEAYFLAREAMALARQQAVDLTAMPEYSVPWQALQDELSEHGGPAVGKIWILGCESIQVAEAIALQNRFVDHACVIHEPIDANEITPFTAKYFNPVVYLFRTKTLDGNDERLVMLVQFKTFPSGDSENTEVVSMAKGKNIYIFDGARAEVRLITFICSDVLGISEELLNECYEGALILHLQLNDKPRSPVYADYRRKIFSPRCDTTELICLNWAKKIKFIIPDSGTEVTKNNISGSAWHSRSGQLDVKDRRVEKNQLGGLYYTKHPIEQRHMLHFSYEPAAFLLRATKVKHVGLPAGVSYRLGPELIDVFNWKRDDRTWNAGHKDISDGFADYCGSYGGGVTDLIPVHAQSPLAAERIVSLSSGTFSAKNNWYEVAELESARIDGAEILHRVTVTHDPESGVKRNNLLSKFQTLAALSGHISFKPPLDDLNNGYRFKWSESNAYCNIESTSEKLDAATVVYAGNGRHPSELAGLYAKTKDLASRGSMPDRFCVVYQDGIFPRVYSPPVPNPINNIKKPGSKDFTEPEK